MTTIERSALVNFSAEQMFALVLDIESYPEFLSGCNGASVLERSDDTVVATMELGTSSLNQSFTTRGRLQAPTRIDMELVDGPFKVFKGEWTFEAIDDKACRVNFKLKYKFSNFLMGVAAGKLVEKVAGEQVNAICQRAKIIYKDSGK